MIDPKELSKLIKGDVDSSSPTLDRVSHDASIFEVRPQVVVRPRNVGDIEKLVRYVNEHPGVTLTARSAGTDMGGGPLSESIVVEFTKYFNKIKKVEEKPQGSIKGTEISGYAITEPGVYYRDFDKATKAKGGQILPSYPASRELCTVGGMVANNSGGEKTLTYGKTERYIRRLKVVLADGKECEFRPLTMHELEQQKKFPSLESEIYRKMQELLDKNRELIEKHRPIVTKNSSGYYLWNVMSQSTFKSPQLSAAPFYKGGISRNGSETGTDASSPLLEKGAAERSEAGGIFDLTKLIVGSQGTLCLVTEIEFALVKPKPYSRLLVVFLNDMTMLGQIANHILQFKPESFESYDDHTFKIAIKFLPALIKQMKGNIISLAFRFLPELWAVMMGGVPKLVLMAEFTGNTAEEAVRKAEEAQRSLRGMKVSSKVTTTAADADKYWVIRRESFNMLRQHVHELRTAPFIDDFVVRPERLPEFLPKLYSILDQYKLTYTIAGHVGDGNFHIIPLMNLHEASSHKIIEELSVKVYELIHEFNGSITGEHNDGIIRTPFIKMMYGEEMNKLFKEVKKIWDPKGIFNPGKKVGGTLEYAFKHIVK